MNCRRVGMLSSSCGERMGREFSGKSTTIRAPMWYLRVAVGETTLNLCKFRRFHRIVKIKCLFSNCCLKRGWFGRSRCTFSNYVPLLIGLQTGVFVKCLSRKPMRFYQKLVPTRVNSLLKVQKPPGCRSAKRRCSRLGRRYRFVALYLPCYTRILMRCLCPRPARR